jgi:hypothetical protein
MSKRLDGCQLPFFRWTQYSRRPPRREFVIVGITAHRKKPRYAGSLLDLDWLAQLLRTFSENMPTRNAS